MPRRTRDRTVWPWTGACRLLGLLAALVFAAAVALLRVQHSTTLLRAPTVLAEKQRLGDNKLTSFALGRVLIQTATKADEAGANEKAPSPSGPAGSAPGLDVAPLPVLPDEPLQLPSTSQGLLRGLTTHVVGRVRSMFGLGGAVAATAAEPLPAAALLVSLSGAHTSPPSTSRLPFARIADLESDSVEVGGSFGLPGGRSWPLLEHLMAMLRTGALDEARLKLPLHFFTSDEIRNVDGALGHASSPAHSADNDDYKDHSNEDPSSSSGLAAETISDNAVSAEVRQHRRQADARRDLIDEIFGVSSPFAKSTLFDEPLLFAAAKERKSSEFAEPVDGGLVGPVLRSSLQQTFVSDTMSSRLISALRQETLPFGSGEARDPCFHSTPAFTTLKPSVPVEPGPEPIFSTPVAVPPLAGSGAVLRGGMAPVTGTASAPSKIPPSSPSASARPASALFPPLEAESLRVLVSRLAEMDFRAAVAKVLMSLSAKGEASSVEAAASTVVDDAEVLSSGLGSSRSGTMLPRGMSAGNPVDAAVLSRGAPPSPSPTPLPSPGPPLDLHANALPPRPFLAHDGRLDASRGRPVLVLGAGAGFFSLKLAGELLPNATVLSIHFPSAAPSAAAHSGGGGYFRPSQVHSLARKEALAAPASAAAFASSWVADASPAEAGLASSSAEGAVFSHEQFVAFEAFLRPRLFSDPLVGGLVPSLSETTTAERDRNHDDDATAVPASADKTLYELPPLSPTALARLAQALGLHMLGGTSSPPLPLSLSLDLLVFSDVAALALDNGPSSRPIALLPFEFEQALGRLLTLSRYSLVVSSEGGGNGPGLPLQLFFAFWPSLEALVVASVEAVEMVPTTRALSEGLGVLVCVQTKAEASYEASLYLRARALLLPAPKGAGTATTAAAVAVPGHALGRHAAPGFVLNFCPDLRPRARGGAAHPSASTGDFGRGLPLAIMGELGLVSSEWTRVAGAIADADLPLGLLVPPTSASRSSKQAALSPAQGQWAVFGSRVLLVTEAVPPATQSTVAATQRQERPQPAPPVTLEKGTRRAEPDSFGAELPETIGQQRVQMPAVTKRKESKRSAALPDAKLAPHAKGATVQKTTEGRSLPASKLTAASASPLANDTEALMLRATAAEASAAAATAKLKQREAERQHQRASLAATSLLILEGGDEHDGPEAKEEPPRTSFSTQDSAPAIEDEDEALLSTPESDEAKDNTSEDEALLSPSSRDLKSRSRLLLETEIAEANDASSSSRMRGLTSRPATGSISSEVEVSSSLFNRHDSTKAVSSKSSSLLAPEEETVEGASQEALLVPSLTDRRWANVRPLRRQGRMIEHTVGPFASSSQYREAAQQAIIVQTEATRGRFRQWWRLLAPELLQPETSPAAFAIMIQGHATVLLSARLARALPHATILVLKTLPQAQAQAATVAAAAAATAAAVEADRGSRGSNIPGQTRAGAAAAAATFSSPSQAFLFYSDAHADLLRLLGVDNALLLDPPPASFSRHSEAEVEGGLTPPVARALASARDPLRFSVFESGLWAPLAAAAAPVLAGSPIFSLFALEELGAETAAFESEAARVAEAIAHLWEERLASMLSVSASSFVALPLPFAKLLAPLLAIQPSVMAATSGCRGTSSRSPFFCAFVAPAAAPAFSGGLAAGLEWGLGTEQRLSSSRGVDLYYLDGDEDDKALGAAGNRDGQEPRGQKRAFFEAALTDDEDSVPTPLVFTPSADAQAATSTMFRRLGPPAKGDEVPRPRLLLAVDDLAGPDTHRSRFDQLHGSDSVQVLHFAASSARRGLALGLGLDLATASAPVQSSLPSAGRLLAARVATLLLARYTPAAAPEAASLESSRAIVRQYGPFRSLCLAAAHRAGLEAASARFLIDVGHHSKAQTPSSLGPLVVLRIDAWPWAAASVAEARDESSENISGTLPGVSLHALLALGVPPALRARLLRLHLALPLNAIARSAHARSIDIFGFSANASFAERGDAPLPTLSLSPTELRLVRTPALPGLAAALAEDHSQRYGGTTTADAMQGVRAGPDASSCAFSLIFVLPSSGALLTSEVFSSALCLTEPLASLRGSGETSVDTAVGNGVGPAPSTRLPLPFAFASGTASNNEAAAPDEEEATRESWAALASQLTPRDTATGGLARAGRFSFVEYRSGLGALSLAVARAFPEATVLSVDSNSDEDDIAAHLAASLRGRVLNNVIAKGVVGAELFQRLHDSPEFFRYQLHSGDFLEALVQAAAPQVRAGVSGSSGGGVVALQAEFGAFFALAATSFLRLPSQVALSLAFATFADTYEDGLWIVPLPPRPGEEPGRPCESLPKASRAGGAALGLAAALSFELVPERCAAPLALSLPPPSLWEAEVGSAEAALALSALVRKFALPLHPWAPFKRVELRMLSALVRAPQGSSAGGNAIRVVAAPIPAPLDLPLSMDSITPALADLFDLGLAAATNEADEATDLSSRFLPMGLSSGLVRVDLAELTRHVNHHFQSDLDGHSRKYTLRVAANFSAAAELALALALPKAAPAVKANPSLRHGRRRSSADPGVSSEPLSEAATAYAVLPPGCHPNHGLTVRLPAWERLPDRVPFGADAGAEERDDESTAAGAKVRRARVAAADAAYAAEAAESACAGSGLIPSACLAADRLRLPPNALLPGVTSIVLTRDGDGALIPYDSVHGITLISGLRLGLLAPLRARAYHQFVSLPLYQDMAPWNIVFLGPRLDYIDYDTRDRTYDAVVPRAYEVMEVLFNYKRTVEDFKRCNGKAGNPYNFPFVSDCVGNSGFSGPCKDSQAPVPCGDGSCRSDYISCLRALSEVERSAALRGNLLWAFRSYEAARRGGVRDEAKAVEARQAGRDVDAATAAGDIETLFGEGDRSHGSSKVGKRRGKEGEPTAAAADASAEAAARRAARRAASKRLSREGSGDEEGFLGSGSLAYDGKGVRRPGI